MDTMTYPSKNEQENKRTNRKTKEVIGKENITECKAFNYINLYFKWTDVGEQPYP